MCKLQMETSNACRQYGQPCHKESSSARVILLDQACSLANLLRLRLLHEDEVDVPVGLGVPVTPWISEIVKTVPV